MKKDYKGIYVALLTPFDKNGKVDTGVLTDVINYNIEKGVSGFYVNGSTAEVFLLTPEERKLIYETCAKAAKGRANLFAHVGAISTEECIRNAKIAEDLGYDAISAVAPFYYKFSFEQIKRHYFTIVDNSSLPMLVYNFPNFSGVNLSVDQVGEFLKDERFIGVKHTSNDYFSLMQFKTAFPDSVIYNGFDEMFLAGLAMGADGGVGSTYNLMAEKFINITKLFNEGRITEAREIQREVCRIIAVMIKNGGIMETEKEIMTQLGFPYGNARGPFSELSDEQKKIIKAEITDRL